MDEACPLIPGDTNELASEPGPNPHHFRSPSEGATMAAWDLTGAGQVVAILAAN